MCSGVSYAVSPNYPTLDFGRDRGTCRMVLMQDGEAIVFIGIKDDLFVLHGQQMLDLKMLII